MDEWEQLFKRKSQIRQDAKEPCYVDARQIRFRFCVANHRSIAGNARSLDAHGARLALSYLSDREKDSIDKLTGELSQTPLIVPCEGTNDDSIAAAFDRSEPSLTTGFSRPFHRFCSTRPGRRSFSRHRAGSLPAGSVGQRLLAQRAEPRRHSPHGSGRQHHRYDLWHAIPATT